MGPTEYYFGITPMEVTVIRFRNVCNMNSTKLDNKTAPHNSKRGMNMKEIPSIWP